MQDLADISEISSQQRELLEAAGFHSKEALGKADPADVHAELKRANEFLKLSPKSPELAEVETWIVQCAGKKLKKTEREVESQNKGEGSQSLRAEESEHQHGEHLEDYVQQVECAIPLPLEAFEKADIALHEVAVANMLSQCDEYNEVKVSKQTDAKPTQTSQQEKGVSARKNENQNEWPEEAFAILPADELTESKGDLESDREANFSAENSESKKQSDEAPRSSAPLLGVDASRVRTMEQFQEETSQMPKTAHTEASLSKVTRAETNKGISRSSRRYIRGVLHNQKAKAYFGATSFIVFWFTCWLPLVGLGLYLLDTKHFWWALYTPAIWLLSLILYFGFALKTSCPVCRQKQFFPKACVKHKNAHKIAGLGLMLPAALHIVLFRWARCIFCGTSLRYKE